MSDKSESVWVDEDGLTHHAIVQETEEFPGAVIGIVWVTAPPGKTLKGTGYDRSNRELLPPGSPAWTFTVDEIAGPAEVLFQIDEARDG